MQRQRLRSSLAQLKWGLVNDDRAGTAAALTALRSVIKTYYAIDALLLEVQTSSTL